MSNLVLRNALIIAITFLWFTACKHRIETTTPDPGTGGGSGIPCDPGKVYFKQQILPLLISNCAMSGCHDDVSHEDGVILTSYEKVMNTADIRPGRPNDSGLYERIIDNDPDDRMPKPPRNPLTQEQRQLIYQWIAQGALNLECQSMCDSSVFTYSGVIKTLIANKCQGCHSGTAAMAGIDLSTYNGVKAKVNDGSLWGTVNHQAGFSAMPKNGAKLSECELAQIRKWIESGSPNN